MKKEFDVLVIGGEVIGMQRADRRITAVQTTRGGFSVREVVLAGGSWSPQIARDIGLAALSVDRFKSLSV